MEFFTGIISEFNSEKIVEGIVIGVFAGLILSILFFLKESVWDERKQIKKLRRIILHFKSEIDGSSEFARKHSLYIFMLQALKFAIESRSPDVDINTIMNIKRVTDEFTMQVEYLGPDLLSGRVHYYTEESIKSNFDYFKKIPALKLSYKPKFDLCNFIRRWLKRFIWGN